MRTITECFNIIHNEIRNLNYSLFDRFQAPAELECIGETEYELDLKFNKELIELYSCSNGTKLDTITPIGMSGLFPLYMFMSLVDAKKHYGFRIPYLKWDLAELSLKPTDTKIFPVFHDGGGASYWIDLNPSSGNNNKIFWIPIPGEYPEYHFDSLTNMMNVICDCYLKKVFFIDQTGYLQEKPEEFRRIAGKYNPKVKYWQK
jgi:hypothetical protein